MFLPDAGLLQVFGKTKDQKIRRKNMQGSKLTF